MVIAIEHSELERLPLSIAVSSVSLAELAGGLAVASTVDMRQIRRVQLSGAKRTFQALSFDLRCAMTYGRVYRQVVERGRRPRGRMPDLLIAATALAHGLPLYTLNADDLRGLEGLIEIVDLG